MSHTSTTQRRRERYGARGIEIQLGGTQFTKLGAARFDWRDPYHLAVTLSWPSFIAAVIGVHLALNVLFGIGYTLMPGSVANARPGSFLDAFFFSIETLATVGYGVMAPQTLPGHLLSSFEIVVGMGYTAVTTGLLFVRFSRPHSSIAYAETIVVARRNGRLTLMLRIGNRRVTTLLDARANLAALLTERTQEGQTFRRPVELALVRSRNPILALTWTLMHEITPDSPLAGYDAAKLEQEQVRLFLSVEAYDPNLAANIHDVRTYLAASVLFGMRYADAVTLDERGHATADIRRLNHVEPDIGAEELVPSN